MYVIISGLDHLFSLRGMSLFLGSTMTDHLRVAMEVKLGFAC